TFAGAVAKVREIKASKTDGDIVVAFKAGNYGPIEAELTAEDGGSPDRQIVYCKYGDGDVIFDNGVTIEPEEFEPISEDERALFQAKQADKIKKIDLSSRLADIPAYDDFALFSDDGFCNVARYPDKYDDGTDHFLAASETIDTTTLHIFHTYMAKRFAAYPAERIPEILIYGYIVRGYRKDTFTLESYDAETQMLTVGYGSSYEYDHKLRQEGGIWWRGEGDTGILMYVFNAAYELDHTDEYWVDRETGTLYVYDPHGSYHIPLPHGEWKVRGEGIINEGMMNEESYCAISAEDTGYITFRGLDFTNTVGEFITGIRTSGFEIDRCSFSCCVASDLLLFVRSLPDEPLGLRVTDSEFDLSTGRQVYVYDEAGGPERFTNRTDALIDNCLFSRANLVVDVEGAVNLACCSGGTVSHNRFENCSRYAVMFTGSADVVVEYNDFDSAMCNSDDGGITRGCGDILGNNIVRYNFYNTISPGSVGHFAHYCDNGDCGTVMYSNLFYNAGNVCYHGSGRDNVLNDNVMIEGSGWAVGSFTEGIIKGEGVSWMVSGLTRDWNKVRGYMETVPGYAEDLISRRPTAATMKFDYADALDRDFYLAPTSTFTGNLFVNDDKEIKGLFVNNSLQYCTFENNVAYTKAENPIFVNPTLGDYRIRDGVDFPDYHFELIGRY
ncbi:MAG: right-handed parallel beta-helix repeat-containing protein, partial [Clostridia bacterium]|nr:right-handed parallel beta-helix repeat-containing protein [Clostridia bacterium]